MSVRAVILSAVEGAVENPVLSAVEGEVERVVQVVQGVSGKSKYSGPQVISNIPIVIGSEKSKSYQ